jgi:hypothetical protein
MALDTELAEIKGIINNEKRNHNNWNPELGYVLINKRANARFMMKGNRGPRDFDNPTAGLVIDSVVTLPER